MKKISLIICFLLFLLAGVVLGKISERAEEIDPLFIVKGADSVDYGDKYQILEDDMAVISKRTYDREKYNCADFSRDLVALLKNDGILANVAVIKRPNDPDGEYHAVVGVWFEPQSGEFVAEGRYVGELNELKARGWTD
jgi:hypothetical protein